MITNTLNTTNRKVLKQRAVKAFVNLTIRKIVIQLIVTFSNILLARLLFPADFGIFATISFVIIIALVFTDIGLGSALIVKEKSIRKIEIQSVFTVQIFLSIILIGLIYIGSDFIASFYQVGGLAKLLRIYSLLLLFTPFKNISLAQLERDLHYGRVVFAELFEQVTTVVFTVTLAFLGYGVLSFIYGNLLGRFLGAILYFILAPKKLQFRISTSGLENLVRFGLPFQLNIILGLFYGPLVLLYLGYAVGEVDLGYFQFAASISIFPLIISEIIYRIIFSFGARVREDHDFLKKVIEASILFTAATTLPIIFILGAVGKELIEIVYTDRWLPSLGAFYVGIANSGVISFTLLFNYFILALGKSKIIRNMSLVWAILTWLIAPQLINQYGFIGMSLTSLIISLSGYWLYLQLRNYISFTWWPNFMPFFLSAAFSGGLAFLMIKSLSLNIFTLSLTVILASFMYALMLIPFMKNRIMTLFKSVTENLSFIAGTK